MKSMKRIVYAVAIIGLLILSAYVTLAYNALSNSYNQIEDSFGKLDKSYNGLLSTRSQALFTQGLLIPVGLDQHYERIRQYETSKFSSKGDRGWLALYVSQILHDLGNHTYPECKTEFNETIGVPCRNLTTQFAKDFVAYVNESASLSVNPGSNTSSIELLYDWVNDFVVYANDTGDFPRFPIETLTYRYGDCEDQAMALSYLLETEGYDTALCFINDKNLTKYGAYGLNHVFCAVRINGFEYNGTLITLKGYEELGRSWLVLDPAFNHMYGEVPEWISNYQAQNGTVLIRPNLWNTLRVDQDELAHEMTQLGIAAS